MLANLTMKKLILIIILLAFLAPVLFAQNPVTNTVQAGSAKAKEVLVIFEVEFKGITPKPIRESVLTDAITAELAEAGTYNLVDRNTQYYFFKQIQEKSKKPCEGAECLTDLAANLDADLFIMADVSKAGKECRFTAKLYKRKPQTVLYFVDQTKIESSSCTASGLEKAAHILGNKLTGREIGIEGKGSDNRAEKPIKFESGKEMLPPGTKGEPMILIPAGEFMMGCNSAVDDKCQNAEKPYHKIYLDAYYIDKYAVTVEQYAKCVQAGGCSEPNAGEICNWGNSGRGNHPINCVDWNQASDYCQWVGKRLPTEAKWEKAARGVDGSVYPYSNRLVCGNSCNSVSPCRHHSTCPVGSYVQDKSPYGVMDMSGNVLEWVNDWFDSEYYDKSPSRNPLGPSSGADRVLRGGSWNSDSQEDLRTSDRIGDNPTAKRNSSGFRCARDAN